MRFRVFRRGPLFLHFSYRSRVNVLYHLNCYRQSEKFGRDPKFCIFPLTPLSGLEFLFRSLVLRVKGNVGGLEDAEFYNESIATIFDA